MRVFLCLTDNPVCRRGTWWIAEDVGEPLFRAKYEGGPRGSHVKQVSRVPVPFDSLANWLVEPGFRYPIGSVGKENREIHDFQHAHEDIIEGELERRGQEANPALPRESTIIVPGDKDANRDTEHQRDPRPDDGERG